MADDLYRAGVRQINVSITLNPRKFTEITRWGDLTKVLDGLEAARSAGLEVKTMLSIKGFNDEELGDMVAVWP